MMLESAVLAVLLGRENTSSSDFNHLQKMPNLLLPKQCWLRYSQMIIIESTIFL